MLYNKEFERTVIKDTIDHHGVRVGDEYRNGTVYGIITDVKLLRIGNSNTTRTFELSLKVDVVAELYTYTGKTYMRAAPGFYLNDGMEDFFYLCNPEERDFMDISKRVGDDSALSRIYLYDMHSYHGSHTRIALGRDSLDGLTYFGDI